MSFEKPDSDEREYVKELLADAEEPTADDLGVGSLEPEPATSFLPVKGPVTQAHVGIAGDFITRIEAMLASHGSEVKAYGVAVTSWSDTETLTLQLDEKRSLQITLTVSK